MSHVIIVLTDHYLCFYCAFTVPKQHSQCTVSAQWKHSKYGLGIFL